VVDENSTRLDEQYDRLCRATGGEQPPRADHDDDWEAARHDPKDSAPLRASRSASSLQCTTVRRTLSECIESVIAQTYSNWEYTIVDNRSTDRSLEIARSYARADPRIRVVENERFLPQVGNINRSLSFVALKPGTSRSSSPMTGFSKVSRGDGRGCRGAPSGRHRQFVLSGRRFGHVDRVGLSQHGHPWTRDRPPIAARLALRLRLPSNLLYRADVLRTRDPVFSETSLHEDTEACYEILLCSPIWASCTRS